MVPAFFSKAMILFNCDYSEGAHADILRRMAETNMEQTAGYGEDPYCDQARKLIAGLCGRTDLDIAPINARCARTRAISMCTSREPLRLADTRFPPFLPRTGS